MINSPSITLSTPTNKNIKSAVTSSTNTQSSFESVFADASKTTTNNNSTDSSSSAVKTDTSQANSSRQSATDIDDKVSSARSEDNSVHQADSKSTANAEAATESSLSSSSESAAEELGANGKQSSLSGNERQEVGQKLAGDVVADSAIDNEAVEELDELDSTLLPETPEKLGSKLEESEDVSITSAQDDLQITDPTLIAAENVPPNPVLKSPMVVSEQLTASVEEVGDASSKDGFTQEEILASTSETSTDGEIVTDLDSTLEVTSDVTVSLDENENTDADVVAIVASQTMEQRLRDMAMSRKSATGAQDELMTGNVVASQTAATLVTNDGELQTISEDAMSLTDDQTTDNLKWVMDQLTQKGQSGKETVAFTNENAEDVEMLSAEGQIDLDLLANKEIELPDDVAELLGGKKQLEQALANLNSPSSTAANMLSANTLTNASNPAAAARTDSAAAQLTMQSQPNTQAWPSEMVTKVTWVAKEGFKTAHIHLDPPELGSLTVKISVDQDSNTQVSFVASSAQAKDALESQLQRLREMLQQQGVSLDSVDVEVSQGNGQSFGSGDQEGEGRNGGLLSGDESLEEDLESNTSYVDTSTKGIDYYA